MCAGEVFPPAVEVWRKQVGEADAFFFASPEYNYAITPVLKNAIDWASRAPNQFNDKAAAVVSAGGGYGGMIFIPTCASIQDICTCNVWPLEAPQQMSGSLSKRACTVHSLRIISFPPRGGLATPD